VSKVSDIKIYLSDLAGSTLTDFFKLPDTLVLEDNTNLMLEKGYAVQIGPAENDTENFCQGKLLISRQYTIRLTNDYVPNMDPDFREGIELTLMESIHSLIVAIQADFELGENAIDAMPTGDTGIQYLISEDGKQEITAALDVRVRYSENF
jgi:hypothetical protein